VKFPVEIRPEGLKAILQNGILENHAAKGQSRKEGED
jgi:HSP20 family molecular chaperone IbpA